MIIGKIIRIVRIQMGMTQEQLSRDLNISFSTINRWENCHTVPSKLAKMRLIEYCRQKDVDEEIIADLKKL